MHSHGMSPPHSNSRVHRTAANASRQAGAPTRGGVTNTCGGERAIKLGMSAQAQVFE